jgi:hypothetical protein
VKGIIALTLAGAIVAIGGGQTVPPPPVVPGAQTPKTTSPTVQTPRTTSPVVQTPQVITPTVTLPQQPTTAGQVFQGTWSATGHRQILKVDGGRSAVTVQMSGAIAVTTSAGLSRGFRGEVIGFDDGAGLIAGRVVWTDERGDQIFSGLFGDALVSASRQMRGTITGGTGRYAGISGEYEFRWQHLVQGDDAAVSGRTVDLRGRVRVGGGRP